MSRKINWEKIEKDYRAGILSLRDIAAPHGITETAIRKKAKKENWQRDLHNKIQDRAGAIMQREIAKTENKQSKANEREVIEINATTIAQIGLNHRYLAERARKQLIGLFNEMEACEESLMGKARIMQSLSGSLKTIVEVERAAWGMDKAAQDAEAQANIQVSFVQPIINKETVANE